MGEISNQLAQTLSLVNARHLIADMDLPAGATWDHSHRKGRPLLPKHLGQRRENRQVPLPGLGIGVRSEAPKFRPDYVKFKRTYAELFP